MSDGLVITRRFLPHWRLEYSTYFITWCKERNVASLQECERTIVVETILHFHQVRYHVWAYVVMDDHAHVIITPMNYELSEILRSWKSISALKINRQRGRKGRLWQPESYDRIVRNETEFVAKMEYILNNPFKRWSGTKEYAWADWTKEEFSYKPKSEI